MSVRTLCNKVASIYTTSTYKNEFGVYTNELTLKYDLMPCRVSPIKNSKTISNGKEREKPSDYRIYIPYKLDIKESDFIIIENKYYDVLYNNRGYNLSHIQVDVKLIDFSEDKRIFYVNENGYYYVNEGNNRYIFE
jgi:hypothetical protein